MAFVSARILTPDQDGVSGYRLVTGGDGKSRIQILGEIIDDAYPSGWITELWIEGKDFDALPASTVGAEDTPQDVRYQAILAYVKQKMPALYVQRRAEIEAGRQITAKSQAFVAALPTITAAMLNG